MNPTTVLSLGCLVTAVRTIDSIVPAIIQDINKASVMLFSLLLWTYYSISTEI